MQSGMGQGDRNSRTRPMQMGGRGKGRKGMVVTSPGQIPTHQNIGARMVQSPVQTYSANTQCMAMAGVPYSYRHYPKVNLNPGALLKTSGVSETS